MPLPMMPFLSTLLLLFQTLCYAHAASNRVQSSTPIREWEGSWAASSTHGTAMAMKCSDNCVALVLVSSKSNVYRVKTRSAIGQEAQCVQDILVQPIQPHTRAGFAPSWVMLDSALLTMNGLATDVEHITRVIQKRVSDHSSVFDDCDRPNILNHLTRYLRDATRFGTRPYAVQGLLVNQQQALISFDMSGGWQSWGRATAVGRYAGSIRKHLGSFLEDHPPTPKHGVELLLQAWYQACKDAGQNVNVEGDEDDKNDVEVLLIWRCPEGTVRFGSAEDVEQMSEMRKRVKERMEEDDERKKTTES